MLVASTTNDRLQQILRIALVNDTRVQGTYMSGEPGRLLTIAMRPETSCSQQGCVQEIRCSTVDDICLAPITGQSEVKTKSSRAFGVLLAALLPVLGTLCEERTDIAGTPPESSL
jgi:hypothetical protein